MLFYARNIEIDEWTILPNENGILTISIEFDLLFANNSTHNVIVSDFAFAIFNIDEQYPDNDMTDYLLTACHDRVLFPSTTFIFDLNEPAQHRVKKRYSCRGKIA